jgi:hypothetical protein
MSLTSEDVRQLVNSQVATIQDELVRSTLEALLIDPILQDREWYGDIYPCWVVAEDLKSDTGYLYWEENHWKTLYWGLASASRRNMEPDYGWYPTLEDAFNDSWASAPLKIWNVVKPNAPDNERLVASSLTSDEATELIEKLNAEKGIHPHGRAMYCEEPRTKRIW